MRLQTRLGSLLAAAGLTLALAGPAQARRHTIAPPGNSSVGQYVENVPTASGGRPTSTVHPHLGPAGRGPGSGGGSAAGAGRAGAVPASVIAALGRNGPDGRADAALADATAPSAGGGSAPGAVSGAGRGGKPSGGNGGNAPTGGASPPAAVADTLAGSGGGLGVILPAILGAIAVGGGLVALLRRRRAG